MVTMAELRAGKQDMDSVLDGCCGTGGFLIEAMADMSATITSNPRLTSREKDNLHHLLRTESLWGIDAGKDPQMARIARLNMLLHKDGGSRIYFADALDKKFESDKGVPLSIRLEIDELRKAIHEHGKRFSCVLTNPPFAMKYERKKPLENGILRQYDLFTDQSGRPRTSLRSSVMFLERYWDLV